MKQRLLITVVVLATVVMASCGPDTTVQVNTPESTIQLRAPGPNPLMNQPDATGRIARAGAGLWHGIIAPITLVISFFNADVNMYEVHNAGPEYDLGFLLGVAFVFLILGLFIRMRR